jgi:hypothetical protein
MSKREIRYDPQRLVHVPIARIDPMRRRDFLHRPGDARIVHNVNPYTVLPVGAYYEVTLETLRLVGWDEVSWDRKGHYVE